MVPTKSSTSQRGLSYLWVEQMASGITYRPDQKALAEHFDKIGDHLYHPKRNWTVLVREHLNKSLDVDGFIAEAHMSKSTSFISHPFPECFCRVSKLADVPNPIKEPNGELLYGGEDECPEWMK